MASEPIQKQDIKDLSKDQLIKWLGSHDIEPYRAVQIFKWIYAGLVDTFDAMTNLKKDIRTLLAAHFSIGRLKTVTMETSRDGCQKFLFELSDGHSIESVLIPERTHDTLCISSQVGCAQGCCFCLTAKIGFIRNLSAGEILSQVRDIRRHVGKDAKLTNIVFMGMGEPLANYPAVRTALSILTDKEFGLGLSPRKITVSTAGLISKLAQLGNDTDIQLAVSLNATDDETRSRLMPINRKYPIEKLLAACWQYPLAPRRKITFEYILIKGVNDSPEDAHQLARILKAGKAKVNLIPLNPHSGCDLERPDDAVVTAFQEILHSHQYTTSIRKSKGTDISAACGQLHARPLE
ncbi:MAG: 23S rRNA (adenine(2503)-C(2))-methyltransferase RlmN [Deltaproteobacteria bacterium]|nr:23S rRNA (adenine(2503)-C(2))-methyltransferase RlmN [Deltaproteobacteria bacterium]